MIFKAKAKGGFSFLVFLLFIAFNSTNGRRYARQTFANEDNNNNNGYGYHHPHFIGNRSVIVQLFEWKFVDIATECRTFLGPHGYAGVQLSPVLEHTVVKTEQLNHPWWERYEVISYRFASRSGDEAEFWSMSRICNEHGVRVYVDVVLNHMAAPLHLLVKGTKKDFMVDTLLESNVNITLMNYSNVSYNHLDFHKIDCQVQYNAQDAHEIRNCQWQNHPDLDHYRNGVRKQIVTMMNKFIDMGVAGFRIDTAKYMWPIDLKSIYQQLKDLSKEFDFEPNTRPFIYQDVFDFGLDSVSKTEYITYGVVSEYLYAAELATILNGKVPLSSLINWGPALGFVPSNDALVFIDSHDTQRGLPLALGQNRVLTYKQRIKYIIANVFMLAHPYGGIKRIMSSYYFQDENQGPPTDDSEGEDISSPKFNEQNQCKKASGWVCEHRWPPLVAMVQMANYFAVPGQQDESIVYFQTNGQNQVAFCRGVQAFVAINNDMENDFNKEVFACLEPGLYCDVVTGGKKAGKEQCHGKQLLINEQGYAKIQLPVADGNRLIGADIENEVGDAEEEQQEMEEEEETGIVESYGILVIYKGSKIESQADTAEETAISQESNGEDKESVDDQVDSAATGEAAETDTAEEVEADAAQNEAEGNGAAEAEEAEAATDDVAETAAGKDDETEAEKAGADGVEADAAKDEGAEAEAEGTEAEVEKDDAAEVKGAEAEAEPETGEDDKAEEAGAEGTEADATEAKSAETETAGDDAAEAEEAQADASDGEEGKEETPETGESKSDVENKASKEEASNADNKNEEIDKEQEEEDTENKGQEETKKTSSEGEENAEAAGDDNLEENNENAEEEKEALAASSQQQEDAASEAGEAENKEDGEEIAEKESKIEAEPQEVADLVVSEISAEGNEQASEEDFEEITENVEKGTEINQSRNLEEPNTEEQVERPSADIVKDAAQTKDVVAAGILSNPKGNGNNG